jgi:aconitate hydratase
VSVRTFNRNFPARSGTPDDLVYLTSPEVAAATAVRGEITDPRDLSVPAPVFEEPERFPVDESGFLRPPSEGTFVPVARGPNIQPLPLPRPMHGHLQAEILIKTRDKISTDDILPAGARIIPLRSNIPALADHVFEFYDPDFVRRAKATPIGIIVGGETYGQGSSREHAAICPMYLGVRAVIAKSFARIHRENLVNFGIAPLVFSDRADYTWLRSGDLLRIEDILAGIDRGELTVSDLSQGRRTFKVVADLTTRQKSVLRGGGALSYLQRALSGPAPGAAPQGQPA